MKLFCAVKVQKKLGCTCEKAPIPGDPLDGWYVNLVQLNDLDSVVAILPAFRFCAILYDVTKEEWPKLNELLVYAIRDALYHPHYQIPRTVIDQYLPEDTVFELCATTDRGVIAKVSTVTTKVLGHEQFYALRPRRGGKYSFRDPEILQFLVNKKGFAENGNWRTDFKEPWRRVKEQLQQRYGAAVPAFELELSLDLPGYAARRTLVVPTDTSFEYLHHYIETAFHWSGNRQYRFYLPPLGERKDPLQILGSTAAEKVPEPEGLYAWADEPRLWDCVREGESFQYLYFTQGNDAPWAVQVTVRRWIPATEDNLPYCTQCSGKAPQAGRSFKSYFLLAEEEADGLDGTKNRKNAKDEKDSVQRVNRRLNSLASYLSDRMDYLF